MLKNTVSSDGLPDLQSEQPSIPIPIDRVGSRGIERFITLAESEQPVHLSVTCLLNVTSRQRGGHLSRIVHALDAAMAEASFRIKTIGDFVRCLWYELARINPDSTRIYAEARGRTVLTNHERYYGSGAPAFKPCELVAIVDGERGQDLELMVGVRAKMCLACPQAQAAIRWMSTKNLSTSFNQDQVTEILKTVPLPTHNQLAEGELLVQVPTGEESRPLSLQLLAIIEEATSSPTYEYLKRYEEGLCVSSLHWKPRLVEDVIREAITRVAREFVKWPDEMSVRMNITSFESTFEYVLDAQTTITLGEIRSASVVGDFISLCAEERR